MSTVLALAGVSDKAALDGIITRAFPNTSFSLDMFDLLQRVWIHYWGSPDRDRRAADVLRLPDDACRVALGLIDGILARPSVGPSDIDYDLVKRCRESAHNLVDLVLMTDRKTCVGRNCDGLLQLQPDAKHRKGRRAELQDLSTTRNKRSALGLHPGFNSHVVGKASLTCKLIKKFCKDCGLEHRLDQAVKRAWEQQNDGRPPISTVYLYADVTKTRWREVSEACFAHHTLFPELDASILHTQATFRGIDKKLAHVAGRWNPDEETMDAVPSSLFAYRKLENAWYL